MIKVAAIQSSFSNDSEANRDLAEKYIREAAGCGAQIVLMPELFENHYFCKTQDAEYFKYAHPWAEHPAKKRFEALAKELKVVIPYSFYELSGQAYFNSIAIIDATGETLGIYRKSHIPQGPGYEEKFYFSPGDTGFKVWKTKYANIGCGICWDQWFPEAARCMTLMGADILFYPTAIGSEPKYPDLDSSEHWRNTQLGHSGANMIPVVTANRVGEESQDDITMTFYGRSFISGNMANVLDSADRAENKILYGEFDLKKNKLDRASWGLFRDRRPELYKRITNYY